MAILGERWTVVVLRDVVNGVRRFDDMRDRTGMPRQVLTNRPTCMRTCGATGPRRGTPSSRTRVTYSRVHDGQWSATRQGRRTRRKIFGCPKWSVGLPSIEVTVLEHVAI